MALITYKDTVRIRKMIEDQGADPKEVAAYFNITLDQVKGYFPGGKLPKVVKKAAVDPTT